MLAFGRRALLSGLLLAIVGCGVHDVSVYSKRPPYAESPHVVLQGQSGSIPLFRFKYTMGYSTCRGIPDPDELAEIQREGAQLGARVLAVDCPPPGAPSCAVCTVYGYDAVAK